MVDIVSKILEDGNSLQITATVRSWDNVYNDVYINKISVASYKDYKNKSTVPSNSFVKTIDGNQKEVTWIIQSGDVISNKEFPEVKNNLFIIWVETKGTPHFPSGTTIPCNADATVVTDMCFNELDWIRDWIPCIKFIDDKCNIPRCLIDKILLYNAIKAYIATGDYDAAIDLFDKNENGESGESRDENSKVCCYG